MVHTTIVRQCEVPACTAAIRMDNRPEAWFCTSHAPGGQTPAFIEYATAALRFTALPCPNSPGSPRHHVITARPTATMNGWDRWCLACGWRQPLHHGEDPAFYDHLLPAPDGSALIDQLLGACPPVPRHIPASEVLASLWEECGGDPERMYEITLRHLPLRCGHVYQAVELAAWAVLGAPAPRGRDILDLYPGRVPAEQLGAMWQLATQLSDATIDALAEAWRVDRTTNCSEPGCSARRAPDPRDQNAWYCNSHTPGDPEA